MVDGDVGPMEDAALLRPESGPALAFTVDFIPPIVDDPYDYGAIAAARAMRVRLSVLYGCDSPAMPTSVHCGASQA